jgi:hypothetical protein
MFISILPLEKIAAMLLEAHCVYGSRMPVEQRAVTAATARPQRRLVGRKAVAAAHCGHTK